MIKLNNPVSEYNGELAVWIDGESIGHWGPGLPNGQWLRDKWYNNPEGQPFEGFRWRTTPDLIINWLWILFFHSNPNAPESHIKYDHIVMATEYIGPIYLESSSTKKLVNSKSELLVFPNPSSGIFSIKKTNETQFKAGSIIKIYNSMGEIVYVKNNADPSISVEVSIDHFLVGLYHIEFEEDNLLYYEKIIKH